MQPTFMNLDTMSQTQDKKPRSALQWLIMVVLGTGTPFF